MSQNTTQPVNEAPAITTMLRDYLTEKGIEVIDQISEKTNISSARILEIYNLADISKDEATALFPYLKVASDELEKEEAKELALIGKTAKIDDFSASKPRQNLSAQLTLPTRAGLRRLFLSNHFRPMRTTQIAFVYSNPEMELRLFCETGLYLPGKNETTVDGSQFVIKGDLKFYILDLRTNRRIAKLVKSIPWSSIEGSPHAAISEKIADFVIEANYRPYCSIHTKYYDLTVPTGDDSKQFWSCHECYTLDRKRKSTENIKVNLTSERYQQVIENLRAQLNNVRRKINSTTVPAHLPPDTISPSSELTQ